MRFIDFLAIAFLFGSTKPLAARTQARQEAAAFVERLYDRYRTGDASSPNLTSADAPVIFEGTLLNLIRRDQEWARGEVGLLDHDPICDCQDAEGLTGLRVTARVLGQTAAEVTAHFTISADQVTVRYRLTYTSASWRIADIRTRDIPSLKAFLAQGSPVRR